MWNYREGKAQYRHLFGYTTTATLSVLEVVSWQLLFPSPVYFLNM